MNLTEEQILTLAPDEASKKSGKDLANAAKWVSAGANESAIWGECQGSGSKPYQTQVDTGNMAFKCSCPSRKFPCKHGLGLLLLYTRQKKIFATSAPPAWVTEWLSKRAEKEQKQAEKISAPVDEAAQAKRQQARLQKVTDGSGELQVWIKDIVRNGILNMPDKGTAWFENMAKRMVDAQAPGLAGMIRNLAEINFYSEGWQTQFMDQLLNLYLVSAGFKNSGSLQEPLTQDLRTWIGFTQNQDEIKEQEGINDTWIVLSKQVTELDNLTTERYWLLGTNSNQYALVLQFLVRNQGGQLTLTPGMFILAELVFFPSVIPLRAIIKRQLSAQPVALPQGFQNWMQVCESETSLNSQLPLRNERPYYIRQLKPVNYQKQWWLQDCEKHMMAMKNEYRYLWKLIALSGGKALDMAVLGLENTYEPVGVWDKSEYHIL